MILQFEEFADILAIKNQIVNAPIEELIEGYKDKESYYEFILSLDKFIEYEPVFFMIDEHYMDNISRIIVVGRNNELSNKINKIISFFNTTKTMDINEKNIKLNNYLCYQEEIRKTVFNNNDEFVRSLAHDAIALSAIIDNKYEIIERPNLFIESINYFLEIVPDLFLEDNIGENTKSILNNIIKESGIFNFKTKVKALNTKNRI